MVFFLQLFASSFLEGFVCPYLAVLTPFPREECTSLLLMQKDVSGRVQTELAESLCGGLLLFSLCQENMFPREGLFLQPGCRMLRHVEQS